MVYRIREYLPELDCLHRPGVTAEGPVADSPHAAIRVEASAEGRFEGRFSLELAATRSLPANSRNFDAAILEHLLAAPEPGERIELNYRCRPNERNTAVALRVSGVTSAADGGVAAQSAQRLFERVSAMLAARRDCEFTPLISDEQPVHLHRMKVMHPGLLFSLRRSAVASTAATPLSSVLLPSISGVEARVPFGRVLAACPVALDVAVSIEPEVLDGSAAMAVAEAVEILRSGGARIMDYPERRKLTRQELDAHHEAIESALLRWLVIPRGIRLRVTFAADQEMPRGTLQLLARTLFFGRRVEVVDVRSEHIWNASDALILADCIHEARAFPDLLPDAEAIAQFSLPRHFPGPQEDLPASGLVLGDVGKTTVCLTDADRSRHLYVIGSTGCGKTTALLTLIRQDMASGRGVCVIDPHGDLFAEALAAVPRYRAKEVVLIDAGDHDHAVGLNFLEAHGPHIDLQRSFIANEMIKIVDRLYDLRVTGGPMFEQYARGALGLLMHSEVPGLTLCELPLLFEDEGVRRFLLQKCTCPQTKRFWSRQAERASGEASLQNMTPYITSKFNQFSNALLHPIIGQSKTTVDFRRIMDSSGVLLVNLSKGLLGELDSALLGMLVIGKISAAAMSRTRVAADQRAPFALYVDEFQNFATETMGSLLAESRKYGIQLILANQHLAQIESDRRGFNLAAAVLANVGTMMTMRLGGPDAERLSSLLRPELSPQDLQYLPDYHAAVRLLSGGKPLRPFVFKTRPSTPVPAAEAAAVGAVIRQRYRTNHARSIAAVAQEIASRHERLLSGSGDA